MQIILILTLIISSCTNNGTKTIRKNSFQKICTTENSKECFCVYRESISVDCKFFDKLTK